MALNFRPTKPEELPRLLEFLKSTRPAGDTSTAYQPDHLYWKYYEPRADWEGSRSYILEEKDSIAAHLAIVPAKLRMGSQTVTCNHFIDWAALPGQFLTGTILLRKITQSFDLTFCIGGSADNRRLLPKFGFQPISSAAVFARPIRPFRQILAHQTRDWRLPLRLGRNFLFSKIPFASAASWRAIAAAPRNVPAEIFDVPDAGGITHIRSAAMFDYFSRSKNPVCAFYLLEQGGRPSGGVCIFFLRGQARIADIWVSKPAVEAFAGALVAAQKACLQQPAIHEVVFRASSPMLREAAVRSGLRFMGEKPIMTFPAKKMGDQYIEAPLIVDDSAYLHSTGSHYLT